MKNIKNVAIGLLTLLCIFFIYRASVYRNAGIIMIKSYDTCKVQLDEAIDIAVANGRDLKTCMDHLDINY